jgi:hypothetical protein
MHLAGGSGLYQFASPSGLANETSCSSDGGSFVAATVTSYGSFVNAVCGTAVLTGQALTIDVGSDGVAEVSNRPYRLDLRAWTGDLEGAGARGVLALRPQHTCLGEPLLNYTLDGVLSVDR